ncbi:MAG: hypothetical protein ACO38H_07950, partial [Ilumatobacteraceae bacterium]
DDAEIRLEINAFISARTASVLETTPDALGAFLEESVLPTPGGAVELAEFVQRAHLRVIGSNDDSIVIVPSELVRIVRDERAYEAEAATVPVPVIGTLKTFHTAAGWIFRIAGGIGLLTLLAGLITRPYRSEIVRAIAELLMSIGIWMVVLGYAVPVHVVPAIDNNTWTGLAPRLALRVAPTTIGAAIVLVFGGLALLLASLSGGRRRQWSSPIPAMQNRDQHRWS